MLRVETQESTDALTVRLEGRFTGEGAEYLRALVTRCHNDLKLIVDLTEVLYVDAVGEDVLALLRKLGAQFICDTAYSRDVCERLHLALVSTGTSNSHALSGSNGNGREANAFAAQGPARSGKQPN